MVRRLHRRLVYVDLRPELFDLLVRNESRICLLERHQTVEVTLCLEESRLGLCRLRSRRGDGCGRSLHARPILRRVDLEKELALCHHLAFFNCQAHDASAYVSADVDLGVRLHLPARSY